jgi:hypothetical protein
MCDAIRCGEHLPGDVRRYDATLRLAAAVVAMAINTGEDASGHFGTILAEDRGELVPGRAGPPEIDLFAPLLLRYRHTGERRR